MPETEHRFETEKKKKKLFQNQSLNHFHYLYAILSAAKRNSITLFSVSSPELLNNSLLCYYI